MNEDECLGKMKAPRDKRNCWRGGILQVMITRGCDLACSHCSAGSNLGGKPMIMTVDQFALAMDSLSTYWGVRAVFGGNPASHKNFDEICRIVKEKVPFEQAGIWCNNPLGKAHLMRGVYDPRVSNLNCHGSQHAYSDFATNWPESIPYLKGMGDSRHSPVFTAMSDLGYTEEEMWQKVSECRCNQEWSALIGVVRGKVSGYVCEIMAHQAMLHENNPDWRGTCQPMPYTGIDVEDAVKNGHEWWNQGMDAFAHQVKEHCFACGVPLNGYGALAVGDTFDQYTKTHEFIMKQKRKDRTSVLVSSKGEVHPDGVRKMTQYIENASLPVIQ